MKTAYILIILMVFFFPSVYAQTDEPIENSPADTNRIKNALNNFVTSHRLRFGIFRILPSVRFGGGVDSNALYSDDANASADFFFTVIPSASIGVKFGEKALLRVIEDVDFLYYRKFSQRRDIFNTTRAEFVTGSRNILFTVDGEHVRRKEVVNEEVDVPVDNEFTSAGIRVDYSATNRIDVRHHLRFGQHIFIPTEELPATFPPLKDMRAISLYNGLGYAFREDIQWDADFRIGRSESLDSGNTTDFWSILLGPNFDKHPLSYQFRLGYGQNRSQQGSSSGNFLLRASAELNSIRHFSLGFFVSRDQEISYFLDQGARVTTSAGINTSVPLIKKISLSGTFRIGNNDYGDNLVGGQVINKDNFYEGEAGLNYNIFSKLTVRGGITYLRRDTDIPNLNKTRTAYFIGLGAGYSLGF